MNKLSIALAAALAAAAPASASDFEAQAADAISGFILEDSFAHVEACKVVDSVNIRQSTLEEARDMLAPCVKAVSQRYSSRIEVQAGFVSSAAPARPGLIFKTELKPGSKQHRDLTASIERRGGRLIGHAVKVLAAGESAPPSVSKAVQAALSRCFIITRVREIQSGRDFVEYYGRCLLRDEELKLSEVKPGRGMTVELKSAKPAADELTGFVTVNSDRGPVSLMVIGRP